MRQSMTLEHLLQSVINQKQAIRDFVTTTKDNVRLVQDPQTQQIVLVLLRDGNTQLEKLEILDHAHKQIAGRLGIPVKYYDRLLKDHPDLVCNQVNALFDREPENRMIRVIDNKVRAFLSNRYARLDNYELLTDTLPAIINDPVQHVVMSSNVNEHNMVLKVIYTDDSLGHEVARARGEPRIIRPGFRISNSETGKGSLKFEAFFFDSYCTNGCVWGSEDAFSFSRNHLGGRVIEGADFEVISQETELKRRDLIKSELIDCLNAVKDPGKVAQMAEVIRAKANGEKIKHPIAAVEQAFRELPLLESEKDGVLETLLRDGDLSQFGLASAITEQANKETISYDRACELEEIGGKILDFSAAQWQRIAFAEKVALAA